MRQHCKTQHGYDPLPLTKKISATRPGNIVSDPSVIQRKLDDAIRQLLRYQELETGRKATKEVLNMVTSPSSAADFILNNYAIINRTRFSALSGYLCYDCLTFQLEYIKDMGFDLIAQKRHNCPDTAVGQSSIVRGYYPRRDELYFEAVKRMINLTEFLFRGQKFLVGQPISHVNPHTYLTLSSMPPSPLPANAITLGKIPLTRETLEEFVKLTFSTYAIFPLAGVQWHVYVTDEH